ncbi:MAG: PD-(D/E)XK nuclease family protein [Janthinobacterium lividum]
MSAPSLATTRPLLARAQQLCQEAEAQQLTVATGAYNCFTVLGIREQEAKHTALLADLLSPCGQHGLGPLFLSAFLKAVGIPSRTPAVWRVTSEESHRHGRWDIALHGRVEGRPALVIVENKINAAEGYRQLDRYLQAAQEHAGNYALADTWLIFLTPDGRAAQSYRQASDAKLLTWSYHEQIRRWLATCLPRTHAVPRLHCVLEQYLDLLTVYYNHHVQQTLSAKLAAHLLQHNLLAEAAALQDALVQARIELQLSFWQELEQELLRHKLPLFHESDWTYSRERITDCYRRARSSKGYGLGIELLQQSPGDRRLLLWLGLDKTLYAGVYLHEQGHFKRAANARRIQFGKPQLRQFADELGLELENNEALLTLPLTKCPLQFAPLQLADMQLLAQPIERQKLVRAIALEAKQLYTKFPRA